jgi:hypothetical protein
LNLRLLLLPALAVVLYAEGTEGVQPETIVDHYCAATRDQARLLDGASMDMEIEAALPKLKKEGRLHALRRIADLGRITYQALRFDGDSVVKKYVIEKYLAAEMEAQKSDSPSISLTPENYKFKFKGQTELDSAKVYMFEVTPLKKRAGLFKGNLWIDAVTYLRVQDAGVMVKSPSIFLKRVSFVRKYGIYNGVAVPRLVQSLVETRLAGKAELTIGYSNISVPAAARAALSEEAVQ